MATKANASMNTTTQNKTTQSNNFQPYKVDNIGEFIDVTPNIQKNTWHPNHGGRAEILKRDKNGLLRIRYILSGHLENGVDPKRVVPATLDTFARHRNKFTDNIGPSLLSSNYHKKTAKKMMQEKIKQKI